MCQPMLAIIPTRLSNVRLRRSLRKYGRTGRGPMLTSCQLLTLAVMSNSLGPTVISFIKCRRTFVVSRLNVSPVTKRHGLRVPSILLVVGPARLSIRKKMFVHNRLLFSSLLLRPLFPRNSLLVMSRSKLVVQIAFMSRVRMSRRLYGVLLVRC